VWISYVEGRYSTSIFYHKRKTPHLIHNAELVVPTDETILFYYYWQESQTFASAGSAIGSAGVSATVLS